VRPEDLEPDDRLTFLLGRVARYHAALESFLRPFWVRLAGGEDGLARFAVPHGAKNLIAGCRRMVAQGPFSERLKVAAEEVFKEANRVIEHEEAGRDRLLHDVWLPNSEDGVDPTSFVAHKLLKSELGTSAREKSLEDVATAGDAIFRVGIRLAAIGHVLDTLASDGPDADIDGMTGVVTGEATIDPPGGSSGHS
jgi:hypothetical protein